MGIVNFYDTDTLCSNKQMGEPNILSKKNKILGLIKKTKNNY